MDSDVTSFPEGMRPAGGRRRFEATQNPAERTTNPGLVRGRIVACATVVGVALRVLAIVATAIAGVGGLAGAVTALILIRRGALVWWVALIPLAVWLAVAVWVVVRLWRMAAAMRDAEAFGGQLMQALDVDWARERVYGALATLAPQQGKRRAGALRTVMAWYRATRLPLQTLEKVTSLPLLVLFAPRALKRTLWMVWVWIFLVVAAPLATVGLAAFL